MKVIQLYKGLSAGSCGDDTEVTLMVSTGWVPFVIQKTAPTGSGLTEKM